MTKAECLYGVSFAIALVLFGLGWGARDAMAVSSSMAGAAQTRSVTLPLGEDGLLPLAGPAEGLCLRAQPLGGEKQVDRGREEIQQLAGPVRRTARRTSRRTSRRQEIIYD